jgi:predicted DNA-binding antitoxin AbrB/MazE fold protein
METIHAIFENGVFRPVVPVQLPEHCEVAFEPRVVNESIGCASDALYEILNRRYNSGHSDTAARHNEHQP